MSVTLMVCYTSGGRYLPIYKIQDRTLLIQAAIQAIREAQGKAEEEFLLDDFIGKIRSDEAHYLECVLKMLIPELGRKGGVSLLEDLSESRN